MFNLIATAFVSILLTLVLQNNAHTRRVQWFTGFSLGLILWNVSLYLMFGHLVAENLSLLLGRLVFWGPLLSSFSYVLLLSYFPMEIPQRKLLRIVTIATAGFALLTIGTPFVVEFIKYNTNSGPAPMYGPLQPILSIYLILLTIFGAYTTVRQFLHVKTPTEKQSLMLLLVSYLCYAIICIGFNFILPFLHIREFVRIGPPLSAITVSLLVAIAMLRHKLFSLQLAARQSIAYTLSMGLVSTIYGMALFFTNHYLLIKNDVFFDIMIIFAISCFYIPAHTFIVKHINRIFKKEIAQYMDKMSYLGEKIKYETDFNKLLLSINDVLLTTLSPKTCSFYLWKDTTFIHTSGEIISVPKNITHTITGLAKDSYIIQASPHIGAIIPILKENKLLGAFFLGPKQSGKDYSIDEMEYLKHFNHTISFALQNTLYIQDIQQKQTQLFQAGKLATIGQTASSIAHEIKNHLAGTLLCITQVQSLSENPEQINLTQTFLKKAEKHILDLQEYVKNMLDFTKRTELTISDYIIHDIIENAKHFVQIQLTDKKINFVAEQGTELVLACDGRKIQQVLLNLFINAIAAMQPAGTLRVSAYQSNDYTYLSVSDTGKGIAAEKLTLIFDPFYTTGGTGIGLSISDEIMNLHKGKILVESTVGKGTTFTLRFPREN